MAEQTAGVFGVVQFEGLVTPGVFRYLVVVGQDDQAGFPGGLRGWGWFQFVGQRLKMGIQPVVAELELGFLGFYLPVSGWNGNQDRKKNGGTSS
ncbi:MAG: hypothetical protein BWY71_00569 [Planctomycetes bacterium ADurb.Bin412]|nr:MAG: hypothetical protein BWY71_00569 [Planctomycetes bacterium ADurb.Bin412]